MEFFTPSNYVATGRPPVVGEFGNSDNRQLYTWLNDHEIELKRHNDFVKRFTPEMASYERKQKEYQRKQMEIADEFQRTLANRPAQEWRIDGYTDESLHQIIYNLKF